MATDANGCLSDQRTNLVEDSTENTAGDSAESFFLTLMILALVLSGGAYVVLRNMQAEAEEVKDAISEAAFADIATAPVASEDGNSPC